MTIVFRRLLLFLSFGFFTATAQLSVTFPVERTVFQRDNNNKGFVHIYGEITRDCDRVEARLTSRSSGQGVTTEWVIIDNRPVGNGYAGKIENAGGWYNLEVRAIKGNDIVAQSTVSRVGIGEVFVIAGQSNAQGEGTSPNANGANDDRVNAFLPNYYNRPLFRYENLPAYFEDLTFGKISSNTHIGPGGFTAWCYGELGDLLVSKLNVPVLFFNAGMSGTSTKNWENSLYGGFAYHEYVRSHTGDPEPLFQQGVPYLPFQITIQSINKLLGFRAVLWHQGEYDADLNVTKERYVTNLSQVINKSRSDINYEIPWVVSRVSRYNNKINPNIIDAQNYIISNVKSVWAGPSTDNIQVNRYDNAHFANLPGSQGLTQLAQVWNSSLTEEFFSQSTPALAQDIIKLNHSCIGNDVVRYSLGSSYSQYHWSNGSQNQNIDVNSGTYSAVVRDNSGNVYRTNSLNVMALFPNSIPDIQTPEGTIGCTGIPFTLQVPDSKYSVIWNTGAINNNLKVNNPGQYSAQFITDQNCRSGNSQPKNISFLPPVNKPMLAFLNNDGNACEEDGIKVGITNVQGANIVWNTGEKSNEITITKNTNPEISVTLYNRPNCPSQPSDKINFNFYSNPEQAHLIKSGPYFLYTDNNPGEFINWFVNGQMIESGSNNYFQINQPGNFQSQLGNVYTVGNGRELVCLSELSVSLEIQPENVLTGVFVYPNPVYDDKIYITSESEKSNLTIKIFDELGRKLITTGLDSLLYPKELDLSSFNLKGKVFVKVEYQSQSAVFPVVFIK